MSSLLNKAGKDLFHKHLKQYSPPDPLYEYTADAKGRKKRSKRPPPPGLSKTDIKILKSVQTRAHHLDKSFSLCGLRFGWTFLIALVPLAGSITGAFLNYLLVIRKARQANIPHWLESRMVFNSALSVAISFIPLVGDVFVAVWKTNSRNAVLLEEFLRIRGEEWLMVEQEREREREREREEEARQWKREEGKEEEEREKEKERKKQRKGRVEETEGSTSATTTTTAVGTTKSATATATTTTTGTAKTTAAEAEPTKNEKRTLLSFFARWQRRRRRRLSDLNQNRKRKEEEEEEEGGGGGGVVVREEEDYTPWTPPAEYEHEPEHEYEYEHDDDPPAPSSIGHPSPSNDGGSGSGSGSIRKRSLAVGGLFGSLGRKAPPAGEKGRFVEHVPEANYKRW